MLPPCFYVSLMDAFGDEWDTTLHAKLLYWIEVRGQTTTMVTETLIFGCSMKVGCCKPSSVNLTLSGVPRTVPTALATIPVVPFFFTTAESVDNTCFYISLTDEFGEGCYIL